VKERSIHILRFTTGTGAGVAVEEDWLWVESKFVQYGADGSAQSSGSQTRAWAASGPKLRCAPLISAAIRFQVASSAVLSGCALFTACVYICVAVP
jgi:hypothetical protein